jgi:peroxiredoxin
VEGATLIGKAAPEWKGLRWLQGGPLDLRGLRGKPVLVRFWTDGCSYCSRSAPALRELWERYRERGLVVVGIHHPKAEASTTPAVIRRAAKALRLDFPIATDERWATVRAYGVGREFTRFTSVSFLIDQCGVIRFVHDGGTIAAEDAAYRVLVSAIEALLAAPLPRCSG